MRKFSFPKKARLLTPANFRYVAKNGKEIHGKVLKIQVCYSPQTERKLGISVSRKYGKSHQRNRFKRLVREAFRLQQHALPPNVLINVRPCHNKTSPLSLETILADFVF